MDTASVAQAVLIAAVVIFVIVRRFAGRPLTARFLLVPVGLTVWGAYQLHGHRVSALDLGFLVISAIVGLALGVARGSTIQIYRRGGHLWQRYRPATLAVWVLTVLVRIGLSAGGHGVGVDLDTDSSLLLTFGISLIVEGAVVALRAGRTGVPFAPSRRRSFAGYR
jgi:hypothetical protein